MKKLTSILLSLIIMLWALMPSLAVSPADIEKTVTDTATYIYNTTPLPQVGSVGGEWAVLGLARSGISIPDSYFEAYYQALEKYVQDCKGVLHNKKYTEYARVILALTAIGKNPADVAGYNLLTPLGDYEKTVWQGINGSIWALIALDSGNYDIPQNQEATIQAAREKYISHILSRQTTDGGWTLSGDVADPDITGMALQALAKYQTQSEVKAATEKALLCMSEKQQASGGFSGWDGENSESCVQMIVALCELGIPLDDARFVKNGRTMLDNLLTFYENGNGFRHTHDSAVNQMATEQCLYALVAAQRMNEGKSSLYRMNDAVIAPVLQKIPAINTKTASKAKNIFAQLSDFIKAADWMPHLIGVEPQ